MKNWLTKYICELFLIISILTLFTTRNTNDKYDKIIIAEGFGYYAYLPGTFIYHDLQNFEWFNTIHPKYYEPSFEIPTQNFLAEAGEKKVDKYFPGLALLWLPFFLLAHILTLILGLSPDGFSVIYQYGIAISACFYSWLGLRYLKKVLHLFEIKEHIISLTLTFIFFGTILFYYTIYAPNHPHAYLFFIISGLTYHCMKLFKKPEKLSATHFIYCCLYIAFIAIIRPFDVIYLLLLPFLGFTFGKIPTLLKEIVLSKKGFIGIGLFSCIVFLLLLVWKIQTGKWIIDPYGEERFYFNNPHIIDILFSYRKGWLLYSPIMAISFFGLFYFKEKIHALTIFIFFSILIYTLSCWWSWTFGTNFGLRPFVDFTVINAIMLALFLSSIKRVKYLKSIIIICFALLCLNLLQTTQYQKGLIDGEYASKETYWKNFFQLKKIPQYAIPPQTILFKEELFYDFENDGFKFGKQNYSEKKAFEGKQSLMMHQGNAFAASMKLKIPTFFINHVDYKIRVSAKVSGVRTNTKSLFAFDFRGANSKESLCWKSCGLEEYLDNQNWVDMQFGTLMPENVSNTDSVSIFFWHTEGTDTTYIDNLKVEFIKTDPSYELKL